MNKIYPFVTGSPAKSAPFAVRFNSDRAFTLTELMVVLAVLAILGGLLLPALAATQDRGNRAACQFNLRQIAMEATQYAGDNNDYVFPAGNNIYPVQFNAPLSFPKVGLTTNSGSIWTCPNRPAFPLLAGSQLVIGYQYYGGITNWMNNLGNFSSHSPVKLSQSKPYWMLAADVIAQPNGINWNVPSGSEPSGWSNLPAHHTADTTVPQGGNEVFCDGSVQWINIHKMYFFHSWATQHPFYFYQDLNDYPQLLPYLRFMSRAGATSPGAQF